MLEEIKNNKKIAIILASKDFKDEEYFVLRELLEKADFEIVNISNQIGVAEGVEGGEVDIDKTIDALKVEDYDALVFIGGSGCLENLDNETSYQIAQEAVSHNKLLAAICISPVILAKAEVLKNKKATVWSDIMDKTPVETLKEHDVDYQDEMVVVDDNIITGNGPEAAQEFAQTIIEKLE